MDTSQFPPSGLPIGQHNLPAWENLQSTLQGIFDRRYYTNHGPLAQELEAQLAEILDVKHAIAVTNATIGLVIAATAVDWEGEVLVSALAPRATKDAIRWAGLTPREVDVDPQTHQMDIAKLCAVVHQQAPDRIQGLVGFHHWGNVQCGPAILEIADEFQLGLIYDASQAVGCATGGQSAASLGKLNVLSFSESDVLNASEGGCVCTHDDELAARIRNMRSSYGAGQPTPIPLTGNARMSEAQAGMALLGLQDLPQHVAHNRRCFQRYQQRLEDVAFARLLPQPAESSFAYAVVELGARVASRVRNRLRAADIPFQNAYDSVVGPCPETPVAHQLRRNTLQLPLGHFVDESFIETVCDVLQEAA